MLKLSNPKENDIVLDAVCGLGIVACEYTQLVSHVTGIDLSPAMIEQAQTLQKEIEW